MQDTAGPRLVPIRAGRVISKLLARENHTTEQKGALTATLPSWFLSARPCRLRSRRFLVESDTWKLNVQVLGDVASYHNAPTAAPQQNVSSSRDFGWPFCSVGHCLYCVYYAVIRFGYIRCNEEMSERSYVMYFTSTDNASPVRSVCFCFHIVISFFMVA